MTLILFAVLLFSLSCFALMLFRFTRQASPRVSAKEAMKLGVSGVIAFIADTLGVGSFAVNVALAKLLGTFKDEELPAVNNGAQVLPGMIESLFFMQIIAVDMTTLVTLVIGACIGGVIGGTIVSLLSKQAIRLAMVCCFIFIIVLLLSHHFRVLPVGGNVTELQSWGLVFGFLGMVVCGALTSVGIGLFVMVQAVLFLLNVSPVVAFPIMTTAGALQQPLTTLVFLKHNKIPLKKTLILSLSGCLGVLVTLPLFTTLTVTWLHFFLLMILIYNAIAIGRAYFNNRQSGKNRTLAHV